jgi:hypothetical protein
LVFENSSSLVFAVARFALRRFNDRTESTPNFSKLSEVPTTLVPVLLIISVISLSDLIKVAARSLAFFGMIFPISAPVFLAVFATSCSSPPSSPNSPFTCSAFFGKSVGMILPISFAVSALVCFNRSASPSMVSNSFLLTSLDCLAAATRPLLSPSIINLNVKFLPDMATSIFRH